MIFLTAFAINFHDNINLEAVKKKLIEILLENINEFRRNIPFEKGRKLPSD